MSNKEDFYTSLKVKLEENHHFPEDYLFKFIIPNDKAKLTAIYQIFDEVKHTINTRESKNAKYISVSLLAFVLDANQVIDIYQKVGEIDNVIML
ncbi:MAG: hypothetical protein CSA38_05205 [Flavobacteriales bacterium]|nr:MAG: hypothetical protein CSA38_05205 [Flavobacteriales bacterium]